MTGVKYVDTPLYCDECIHCKRAGEMMVGSDATGGGPEEAFTCEKDRVMDYYCFHQEETCPDCDHGDW